MLLPQRTNFLIDLWEKVQQPAAKAALSSFQLTIHNPRNQRRTETITVKGLVQVIVLWHGFDGRRLNFGIIPHCYFLAGESDGGAMGCMRSSKQWFHPPW